MDVVVALALLVVLEPLVDVVGRVVGLVKPPGVVVQAQVRSDGGK